MSSGLSSNQSGYKFGATFVGNQIVGPGEAYPVFLGDIDPSGNLNANILGQFHPRLRTRVVVQVLRYLMQPLEEWIENAILIAISYLDSRLKDNRLSSVE